MLWAVGAVQSPAGEEPGCRGQLHRKIATRSRGVEEQSNLMGGNESLQLVTTVQGPVPWILDAAADFGGDVFERREARSRYGSYGSGGTRSRHDAKARRALEYASVMGPLSRRSIGLGEGSPKGLADWLE